MIMKNGGRLIGIAETGGSPSLLAMSRDGGSENLKGSVIRILAIKVASGVVESFTGPTPWVCYHGKSHYYRQSVPGSAQDNMEIPGLVIR
ncbi:hypothetical protein VC623_16435 [Citrobacter amalonaticus]|uniref:hypothetical protein n=1 Tax=Citrobacter amalonaticus TaxID=35703 RepID=UPI00292BC3CA|nr:hypothetical protein [Citrobacter amalonaticus]MDV0786205.1 hypothetical protein [Citrobacter amalonaticus]MEB0642268.1 hypothetical protein [Citrobacter amalonaticus]